MAEKIALEIDIDAKGSVQSLGQLEQEAERLNEELRKVPLGSKAFKDLQKELIGVNKEIKNTELSLEALDNEQVASELGSVAGAVGDVSAAFILLGGGDGAIEQTVQNIEKAIGVSMAFKGAIEGTQSAMKLFNNIVKNSTVFQKANNATTLAATSIMGLFSKSVNTTSKSFRTLKGAIAATGIGLVLVGVGELVANFDKIKNAISGINEESENLLTNEQLKVDLAKDNLTTLQNQENILKLQGKTEREILDMKIKAQKQVIEGLKGEILAQEIVNKEKIDGTIRNKELLIKTAEILFIIPRTLIKGIDLLGEGLGTIINKITQNKLMQKLFGLEAVTIDLGFSEDIDDFIDYAASFVFDPDATQKDADDQMKVLKDALLQQENALAGFQLRVIDMNAKAAQKTKDAKDKANKDAKDKKDKEAAEEAQRLAAQYMQDLEDYYNFLQSKEDLENQYFDTLLTKQDLEENAVADKYFRLIELAKQYGEDTTILEEAQQAEIDKIKAKYAREDLMRQQAVENAKLQLASDGIGALMNLTSAFAKDNEKSQKRAFEINKKLQMAQAIIQTYQGATAIFASAAANPGTILFPAQPFIAAGIAIANGLANVAQISKQQFQSSQPGSSDLATPSFQGGGAAPTLQPANTSLLVPQQQNQVYVTETDITNVQNQVSVIQGMGGFG